MSKQDTPWPSRVKEADKAAGIVNGLIWMDAVEDLGNGYRAIAKMYAPRPGDLEFIIDPEERLRAVSMLRRYGVAKMLVFYDDASIRLEQLKKTSDPQERGPILLEIFRRSLDVSHPYLEYGWQALEVLLEVNQKDLRTELEKFTSEQRRSFAR